MHQVSIEKTSTIHLPDLIDSVVNGDEIIFTQNNQPVAKLIAYRGSKAKPQKGSAKGLIIIADDFDEPLTDFDEYTR